MLRLPFPFGLYLNNPGTHIAISAPHYHAKQIANAAKAYGCPTRARAKIVECIRSSERYDCIVSAAVSKHFLDEFVGKVRRLGGAVVITPVRNFQSETRRA